MCVCVIGDTRCSNLSLTLEGIFQHGPEHWTLKSGPESSHPLEHIWFTKVLHASHLLLNLSNHHDIIDEIDQLDVLWDVQAVQVSSDYSITEDGREIDLRQNCK